MDTLRLWILTFVPVMALSPLISACAPNQGVSFTLEGTRWQLNSINGEAVLPNTNISADFGEDGSLGGSSGCNSYSAQYELDGDRITIGPAATTLMACPEPIMEQESAYMSALASVASYALEDDNLVLLDDKGGTLLVFEPQEEVSLEGTAWEVISYNNGKEAVVSVIIGTEMTAEFGADGILSGFSGCNNYNASYELDEENINIGPAASTRKYCPEPEGVMEQEGQFLAALETAARYEIENDRLDMFTEESSWVGIFNKIR